MSFRIVYDSEATAEFREAVTWYEGQAEGLGTRFTHDVDKVMAAIISQPLRFSRIGKFGRKARTLGWPYTIFFTVNESRSEIKVVAVWHGARNPVDLQGRLK